MSPRLLRLGASCVSPFGWIVVVSALCASLVSANPAQPGRCAVGGRFRSPAQGEADVLFRDEMRQAQSGLHWRGERLTDECVYAAAVTGASWESAWGREPLFWMGWRDCRDRGGRLAAREREATEEIRTAFAVQDYRRVISVAMNAFSLEQISCDPELKTAVGTSFLELGQPERAFPIFASPFKAARITRELIDRNRLFRERALEAARRAGLRKEAIAFQVSLLLAPGGERPEVDQHALEDLERAGVDIDRVLRGILAAPPRLRGLPEYTYSAADLLALRARPRDLPLLLALEESDDVHLRSRALLGLGILAFRARSTDSPDRLHAIVPVSLQEVGVSEGQRALIHRAVLDAARDGRYRLRAAAALALGLIGDEGDLSLLRRLAQDRAYVLSPPGSDRTQRIQFPVCRAAAAALGRFGVTVFPSDLVLASRSLESVRRGNQDVSHDRSGLRREVYCALAVVPTDLPPPVTFGVE